MALLVHPSSELIREPRLLVPGMQPLGPVKLSKSHPIVAAASHIYLCNEGRFPPVNKLSGVEMTHTTTGGAWTKQIVSGKACVARSDTDESGGYFSAGTFTQDANTPLFFFVSYCLLAAPSAVSKGAMSIGSSAADSSPYIALISASTTNLQLHWGGNYWITTIGVRVGVWERLALVYPGNGANSHCWYGDHQYASASRTPTNLTAPTLYIGSAFNAQLPIAVDMVVVGQRNISDAWGDSWHLDPWQIVEPA